MIPIKSATRVTKKKKQIFDQETSQYRSHSAHFLLLQVDWYKKEETQKNKKEIFIQEIIKDEENTNKCRFDTHLRVKLQVSSF